MTVITPLAQEGKASTIKNTFSRQTSVTIDIKSDISIVWTLLTNVSDFTRWNSTIISIAGEVAEGAKISLKSTLDEKRIFLLKVKELKPEQRMVWGDGKGNRVFEISTTGEDRVVFSMNEKIGGLMYPLYAKYIPCFDESFEQFASDLKKEAELIYNTKN